MKRRINLADEGEPESHEMLEHAVDDLAKKTNAPAHLIRFAMRNPNPLRTIAL
jgi:hypothetical protein